MYLRHISGRTQQNLKELSTAVAESRFDPPTGIVEISYSLQYTPYRPPYRYTGKSLQYTVYTLPPPLPVYWKSGKSLQYTVYWKIFTVYSILEKSYSIQYSEKISRLRRGIQYS